MRVAILTSRFPEPDGRGDQNRLFFFMQHLSQRHEVRCVSSGPPSTQTAERRARELGDVHVLSCGRAERAAGAVAAWARGLPAQVGWMTPPRAWSRAKALCYEFDVALVNTVRAAWSPPPIPYVLDHVDALSLNMARRALGNEARPVRVIARLEAALLRRHERRLGGDASAQVVSSIADSRELPVVPAMTVLPTGWDGSLFVDPPGHVRDLDVVFSGTMHYPPNRSAAMRLAKEILPLVRRTNPKVRACIVGRHANSLPLEGVEIASDVADVGAYLRRARIAVVPLAEETGTGSPRKLVEAAANGAALVVTPWTAEAYGVPAVAAVTNTEFAHQINRLLEDDQVRRTAVEAVRASLEPVRIGRLSERLEAVLVAASGPQGECSDSVTFVLGKQP